MSKATLQATYNQLAKLVREYKQALDGVADEDFSSWKPSAAAIGGGEMNTFSGLSVHVIQAAAWRIVHQIFGLEYPRDREHEFDATDSRAEIDLRFDEVLARFASLIESGPEVDLNSLPPTIRQESPDGTRLEYLIQVVGHTALHLGHAQIHRQLWQAERGNGPS